MSPDDPKNKANDIAGSAATKASDRVNAAIDDVKGYTADLAARGREAGAQAAASAKQSLNEAAERIPKTASDALDMGSDVYARSNAEVSRQVRKQPLEALMLAGAIGFLVGWAVNRS